MNPATATPSYPSAALASLSLATLLSSLGMSSANVALPTLAQAFDASFGQVQWVVIAYLLAITTLVVSVGRLGDLIGRRRLLLAGLALFTAASVLCGLAPTLWLLIAARVGQGLGAAIMVALAMALISETVPKQRTGSAMGVLGTMSAIGIALGPSLGGMLIEWLGWRAIFLVKVPLGLLTYVLVQRCVSPDRADAAHGPASFDHVGTLLLALTLGAYALAMTIGRGQVGPLNLALLLAAALGLALFLLAQAKVTSPLIQLKLLRDPALNASLATSALVSTVMMGTLVVGPFYLSRGFGLDPAMVGLVMSVGPIAAALAGVPAGRLADRFGARRMALTGMACTGTGSLALSLTPLGFGVPGYLGPLVCMTIGYSLFQTANNTAVMAGIAPERRGVFSGVLNLSRNLGFITGASVMGALFSLGAATPDMGTAHPQAVAAGMRLTFMFAFGILVIALAVAAVGQRRGARATI